MKPSELFGVVVRTSGLLIFLYGLWELWGGVENMVENLLATADSTDQTSSLAFFADGFPSVIAGVVLFFAANFVVRLAYGRPSA